MSSPDYKLTVKAESEIDQSLTQWVSSCKDILNEPVTTGRHFNTNLAQKVFQTYDDTLEKRFGDNWVDPRALVCWQRIVGRMECLFPANYTQAGCDGFYSTAEKLKNGTPQARSFRLEVYDHSRRAWVWVDDVSVVAGGCSVLGVDFAIGRCELGLPLAYAPSGGMRYFESYVSQKQLAYRTYASTPRLSI